MAIGFGSLCLGGMLSLMLMVVLVGRKKPVDGADGCLAFFLSSLLAVVAIAVLSLAL
jgi:hypothetical protein